MSLTRKFILIFSVAVAGFLLLGYLTLRAIVLPSFLQLEQMQARKDVARVQLALDNEADSLERTAIDWALWEATYRFTTGSFPEFAQINLLPETLDNLSVDLLHFYDIAGTSIWTQSNDAPQAKPAASLLDAQVQSLLQTAQVGSTASGLIFSEQGIILAGAAPITADSGEIGGVLVLGRILDDQRLAEIQQRIGVDFTLTAKQPVSLNATDGSDDARRVTSVVVRDLLGEAGFTLRVSSATDISTGGSRAVRLAMLVTLGGSVLFLMLLWTLIDRQFVQPLSRLGAHLSSIRTSGDLSRRLDLSRKDEIGQLAGQFDELTEELQRGTQDRDEALAESAHKSRFLATMSHEIRTPMNAVLGMTELLLTTRLNDRQRRLAQTVQSSGTMLLEIINDVLDYSKIAAGRIELEYTNTDLGELLEDLGALFAESAHAKKLELICAIDPPGMPRNYAADAGRLRQILTNLIGNAIKFTASGDVTVVMSTTAGGLNIDYVRFEVRDTGIGIRSEACDRVFESFAQEDSSTTRRFGGTGLGLAICRQLAQLMGGEIGVDSTPGVGATFWLEVPLERREPDLGHALPVIVPSGKPRVLIVEDNDSARRFLTSLMDEWMLPRHACCNAHEALTALAAVPCQEPYDIVLLDLSLPGMDGSALARQIRADRNHDKMRLILLAAPGASREPGDAVLKNGDRSLTKPLRPRQLARAMSAALRGIPEDLHRADTTQKTDRNCNAKILIAEDNRVNVEVARGMLEQLNCEVAVAENGREAVAMSADEHYDMIFMDCQMPEMDGFEATRYIRSRKKQSGMRVPIIAVTANAMQGDKERCLEAGMDDYISKPYTADTLYETITRWHRATEKQADSNDVTTQRSDGDGPVRAAQLPVAPGESASASIDRSILQALATGDTTSDSGSDQRLQELADHYLRHSEALVEELTEAVRANDCLSAHSAADRLLSASNQIGAPRLTSLCASLLVLCEPHRPRESRLEELRRLRLEHAMVVDALASTLAESAV